MSNNLLVVLLVIMAGIGAFFAYKAGKSDGGVVREITREVEKTTEDGTSLKLNINESVDLLSGNKD